MISSLAKEWVFNTEILSSDTHHFIYLFVFICSIASSSNSALVPDMEDPHGCAEKAYKRSKLRIVANMLHSSWTHTEEPQRVSNKRVLLEKS